MSRQEFDLRVTEELHRMVDDAFPSQMLRPRAELRAAELRQRRRVPSRTTLLLSGAIAAVVLVVVGVALLNRGPEHSSRRVFVDQPTVPVPQPGPDVNVPADAQGTGVISGLVTAGGAPLKGANVRVAIDPCCLYRETFSGDDGRYTITGLPAGRYTVGFTKGARSSMYREQSNFGDAERISVGDGQHVSGIDGTLILGSTISGRVTNAAGAPLVGLWVYFDGGPSYGKVETDAAGRYAINNLPPGDYSIKFDPGPANLPYIGEYYNDKPETSQADRIHVDDGTQAPNINAVLANA